MLSAAHVLAMDAKNLLDVIDSIRSRFPNLFHISSESRSNKSTPTNSATSSPSRKIKPQSHQLQPPPLKRILSPSVEQSGPENMYQNSAEENQYQNLSQFNLPGASQPPPTETSQAENLYANEQLQAFYDNDQTKAAPEGSATGVSSNNNNNSEEKRTRPLVAAKPFNFNIVKVKTNFGNGSTATAASTNELKIIEDDLAADSSCSAAEMKLPEPVSCSIVQENLFKKNQLLHKQWTVI